MFAGLLACRCCGHLLALSLVVGDDPEIGASDRQPGDHGVYPAGEGAAPRRLRAALQRDPPQVGQLTVTRSVTRDKITIHV